MLLPPCPRRPAPYRASLTPSARWQTKLGARGQSFTKPVFAPHLSGASSLPQGSSFDSVVTEMLRKFNDSHRTLITTVTAKEVRHAPRAITNTARRL